MIARRAKKKISKKSSVWLNLDLKWIRKKLRISSGILSYQYAKKTQKIKIDPLTILTTFSSEASKYCCRVIFGLQNEKIEFGSETQKDLDEWIQAIQESQIIEIEKLFPKKKNLSRSLSLDSSQIGSSLVLIKNETEQDKITFEPKYIKFSTTELFIYQEFEGQPEEIVNLIREDTVITRHPDHNLAFEISNEDQNYYIITSSHAEKMKWVQNLNMIIERFKKIEKENDESQKKLFRHLSFKSPSALFFTHAINYEDEDEDKQFKNQTNQTIQKNQKNQENQVIQDIDLEKLDLDDILDDPLLVEQIESDSSVEDESKYSSVIVRAGNDDNQQVYVKEIIKMVQGDSSKSLLNLTKTLKRDQKLNEDDDQTIIYGRRKNTFEHLLTKFYQQENYEENILQDENEQLKQELQEQQDLVQNLNQRNLVLLHKLTSMLEQRENLMFSVSEQNIPFEFCFHQFTNFENKELVKEISYMLEHFADLNNSFQLLSKELNRLEKQDEKLSEEIKTILEQQKQKLETKKEKNISKEELNQLNKQNSDLEMDFYDCLLFQKQNLETNILIIKNYLLILEEQKSHQSEFFAQQIREKNSKLKKRIEGLSALSIKMKEIKTEFEETSPRQKRKEF
ncbi:variant sh3 domain containing protein [Anaeramoeba ignava]|uniref:Variant sh3 domain containing protein n=1 Tax=Anaeramoeba ignava TaxID=1746090 RepID=A0A9Q0L8M4_ANAIG|nr:variant sh3 domain containing protein [Anaeramoeba ignava]